MKGYRSMKKTERGEFMRKVVIGLLSLRGVGLGDVTSLASKSCKRRTCLWGTEKAMAALAMGLGRERENRARLGNSCPPTESRALVWASRWSEQTRRH